MLAKPLFRRFLDSPVGRLTLIASGDGDASCLAAILWENERPGRVRLAEARETASHPVLDLAARQLGEYFAGLRTAFDLPVCPDGTGFQQAVWRALTSIPYGRTRSYSELASEIGRPEACRAVGAANGRNPLSIVVPCHRVIGKSGYLTGFAGGLATKAALLDLERRVCGSAR